MFFESTKIVLLYDSRAIKSTASFDVVNKNPINLVKTAKKPVED
jgi:hypothetical protein